MTEFFGGGPDQLGGEFESEYNGTLILVIASFLCSRRYGESFAENIRDSAMKLFGEQPQVPTGISTEISFHNANMNACSKLEELESYARTNGFGWLTPDEIKKCEKEAIELMELGSEPDPEE